MSHHYTRGTESVTRWCHACGRPTQHAVSTGRPGRCLEHDPPELTQEQKRRREREASRRQNPSLFPDSTRKENP